MSEESLPPQLRVCVVIPTYNNRDAVASVVVGARQRVADVIVVDDGSTDGSAETLAALADITVLRHEHNRGKGAALLSGFEHAIRRGFTHAITIDGDGQHDPADLPSFLEAIRQHDHAIVIGVRQLPRGRMPLKSRILRTHSNFWVWCETGRWVHDSQSGFRAYPLEAMNRLRLKTRKYDFEIESLVKAMWAQTPVVEVPVGARYAPRGTSHFRPLRDFALVSLLNAKLMAQRLFLPLSLLRTIHVRNPAGGNEPRRFWQILRAATVSGCDRPGSFAASIGIGVFFGILPVWGFQLIAAAAAAHYLRLSKPLAMAASNISFPAAIPCILYASLLTGHLLFTGRALAMPLPTDFRIALARYGVEYLVGSTVLALVAGIAAAAVARSLAFLLPLIRQRRGS